MVSFVVCLHPAQISSGSLAGAGGTQWATAPVAPASNKSSSSQEKEKEEKTPKQPEAEYVIKNGKTEKIARCVTSQMTVHNFQFAVS